MTSTLEVLQKSKDYLELGWPRDLTNNPTSYKIYVSKTPSAASMVLLASNISASATGSVIYPTSLGKVYYKALAADVRTVLSLAATIDFSNTMFYFTITYVDGAGVESAIADSTIVEVPPVGIGVLTMREDPTTNRHGYVFSTDNQIWVKMAGSGRGAVIVDNSDYYKDNVTSEYTYDGTDLKTVKSYLSDTTASGSFAKLTTYTYAASKLTKMVITDTTV